jgi:hypothetical protein
MIKLDSVVDVRCDFCSRVGRRGYIMADISGLEILCPACFVFLHGDGGWKPGEAWEESEVSWEHVNNVLKTDKVSMKEFKKMYLPGDKDE